MFRFLTAGESHGPVLTAIIEGIPAGLPLSADTINTQLRRRQGGYGRGGRMKIEKDQVNFRSGVRHGYTLGSPITLEIENKDWQNWQIKMSASPVDEPVEEITQVRPGHADLTGAIKYGHKDVRNVIERASSRETAARVAVGAVCRIFLEYFGVKVYSHVLSIGPEGFESYKTSILDNELNESYWEKVENSPVRCGDSEMEAKMVEYIHDSKTRADTCGGVFEVVAVGVPVGLGSYSQWDRRLSTKLGATFMSIPAVKGVEIGGGFSSSAVPGSDVHDVVRYNKNEGWQHQTNNAGGIEGGISNGAPVVVRAAIKPIPTLAHPLPSVDIQTFENLEEGRYERSDVCVVPAAGVVGEAMMAIALTDAWIEKFAGDNINETKANFQAFTSSYQQR